MAEIVPTILTNDKNIYRKQYAAYSQFAKRVQVDICDNLFTKTQTIDLTNAYREQSWAKMDLHMLVMNPSSYLPIIFKLKPSLVIFHAETNENLIPIFEQLKQQQIKTGVAILKQTYPGRIAEYIKRADHCLIFAGDLGKQGGTADMLQIEKVPIIKQIDQKVEIGWDGGVNMNNIREIAHSNIDIINVGAALSTSQTPQKTYQELFEESEKLGVRI